MSSAFLAPKPKPSTSRTHFIRVISSKRSFPLISSILESIQAGCQSRQKELLPSPPPKAKLAILAKSIATSPKKQTGTGMYRKERRQFLPSPKDRRVPMPHFVWTNAHQGKRTCFISIRSQLISSSQHLSVFQEGCKTLHKTSLCK